MTDALVIGSGPNGLAAAIRLLEAGRSVTVLEAASQPGGAVRTEELTLPGFHHDTFSSVYPAAAASPVFGRMPLAEHGLNWVHPRACSAHPLPEGEAAVLYRDLGDTARTLDAQSPGDGTRWVEYVTPFLESFPAIRETMLTGFPPVKGPLKLLRSAGPQGLFEFTRMLSGSATGLGNRLFNSPGSRAWLYGAAIHGDTPPGRAGSAIAAFYLNLMGHAVGWPSPEGGAQKLTDALVSYLRSLGGEVITDSKVDRILVADGQVRGAGVADGDEYSAPIVVADVMPDALQRMTGEALATWYRKGLKMFVYGPATIKVDWALDDSIPWMNDEVRGAGTVHVGGSENDLIQSIDESLTGLPDRPVLLLGQQSVADPTRAPAGKHTAWAYTHGPADADWVTQQDRHVEAMEEQVERFAPGFRDRILARHVQGPADLQRSNANLIHGDVGGGSYKLRQAVFRPLPVLSPYSTPVSGLFLGSAATFPGGAVHGVPGDAAARAALRRSS